VKVKYGTKVISFIDEAKFAVQLNAELAKQ